MLTIFDNIIYIFVSDGLKNLLMVRDLWQSLTVDSATL